MSSVHCASLSVGSRFADEIHFAINDPISAAPSRISSGFARRRSSSFAVHVRSAAHLLAARRRPSRTRECAEAAARCHFETNCEQCLRSWLDIRGQRWPEAHGGVARRAMSRISPFIVLVLLALIPTPEILAADYENGLAPPGAPPSAFPTPSRPVAGIVTDIWRDENRATG